MDTPNIVKNTGLAFVGWFLVFVLAHFLGILESLMGLFSFGGLVATVAFSWLIENRQAKRNFPNDEQRQKQYLSDAGFTDTTLRVVGYAVALVLAIIFTYN